MTTYELFDELTERSRRFAKGIDSLNVVKAALEKLKEDAEVSCLEIVDVDLSRNILICVKPPFATV